MIDKCFFDEDEFVANPDKSVPEVYRCLDQCGQLLSKPTSYTPEYARMYVGWFNNDKSYKVRAGAFRDAGHQLVEAVLQGADGNSLGRYVIPILYLYRQALEIILKRIAYRPCINIDDADHKKMKGSHDLGYIWGLIKDYYPDELGEPVQVVHSMISEISKADPDGHTLRYDTKKGKAGSYHRIEMPDRIDLLMLRSSFIRLWQALDAFDEVTDMKVD